jgi:hypothetical protein
VQISRNGKYILSAGKDNTCRLFDISAGMGNPPCVSLACCVSLLLLRSITRRPEGNLCVRFGYHGCAHELCWMIATQYKYSVPRLGGSNCVSCFKVYTAAVCDDKTRHDTYHQGG